MSGPLLAEFRDPEALVAAATRARTAGWQGLDAYTPFSVDGLAEALALPTSRIRPTMLLAGLIGAGFVYLLCWYSAVVDYPLNLGGRPLHSWPVFLVLSFEAGVLAATLTGILWFFLATGLPRPHHPIFAAPDFERASQDRFFLAVADTAVDEAAFLQLLDGLDPVQVQRLRP